MKNYIYLDNAAKTEPLFHRSDYKDLWFNSNTSYATLSSEALEEAKNRIKKCLGVSSGKIVFFRCASDIAKWLYDNTCYDCSKYEHDSVYIYNDSNFPNNEAYSHQFVNQMTGSVFYKTKEDFPNISFLFSDMTATVGHWALPNNIEKIYDAVWYDGIKIHTEGNISALWISDNFAGYLHAEDSPRNQYNLLHGSNDVEGAIMLAQATEDAIKEIEIKEEKWEMLSDIILHDLRKSGIDCYYIADDNLRTHAINALRLLNINADALQICLATKNIYVGTGHSACSGYADYRVLEAFGLNKEEASEVIRVSFDEDTTIHDVKGLIEAIIEFKRRFV